jgi:hypothetical protein
MDMKGLGSRRCIEVVPSGRGCQNLEVEGMDFCLKHMPDELLAEAEEVTGVRRCRHEAGCREYAEPETDPPACRKHKPEKIAKGKIIALHAGMGERATEIVAMHAHELENPPPLNDPYGELMAITAEMRTWKDILRRKVAGLTRYGYQAKAGEQMQTDVLLYTQAMRDVAQVLLAVGRLNIDARLIGIRQQTAASLERALDLAFEEADVPLDKRQQARETFRRNLKVVA